jgi:hypothetical protein
MRKQGRYNMSINRREFIATVSSIASQAYLAGKAVGLELTSASNAPSNIADGEYLWRRLRIGAGGYITGLAMANDGTCVIRTDTYGGYRWGGLQNVWSQLITDSSMPSPFNRVDNNAGIYEIAIAPGRSDVLFMSYLGRVFRSGNGGRRW